MKLMLNKWQLVWSHGNVYRSNYDDGWRGVDVGIVKLTSYPSSGQCLTRENYKGILVRFVYWFPIRFV